MPTLLPQRPAVSQVLLARCCQAGRRILSLSYTCSMASSHPDNPTHATMETQKPLPLDISDSDIDAATHQAIAKAIVATRKLGPNAPVGQQESLHRRVIDLLPTIIAKRVNEIVPSDFSLDSLQIKFSLEGRLFGSGVSGEVVATLKRSAQKPS
jgi:hypothetical protein